MPIRVGILGLGKVGQLRAEALLQNHAAEFVGFFDPDSNAALNFSSVTKYSSSEELILDPDVEAVFVCTPNHFLKDMTVKALSQGKHVLCEKPPGRNLAEFLEIENAKNNSPNTVLKFGFNHRHKDSVKQILVLVNSGDLGEINWVRCRYGKNRELEINNWRNVPEYAGGGILLDQGIHGLDIILELLGNVDEVQAMISADPETSSVLETNAFVQLRNNATGVSASLHSTSTQWRYVFALEISMTRGSIVLNGLKTPSGRYGEEILTAKVWDGSELRTIMENKFLDDTSWNSQVNDFIENCESGNVSPIGGLEQAKRLSEMLDKIYGSDKTWKTKIQMCNDVS